jgi:hypothetical protein
VNYRHPLTKRRQVVRSLVIRPPFETGGHRGRRPAYLDRAGTSNGPTEAINGRLEHLCGSALGFRNLANYIARSLLEAGGFRPQLHTRIG